MTGNELPSIRKNLLAIDWFRELSPSVFEELLKTGRMRTLLRNEWLWGEGDSFGGIATILSGTASFWTTTGDDRLAMLGIFGPGMVFGQSSHLGGGERLITVTAREHATLFTVGDADLLRVATAQPAFWQSFASLLYMQLQHCLGLCGMMLLPTRARIARRLLSLGPVRRRSDGIDWLTIRQDELAELCCLSREVLNGYLRDFESDGLLERRYGKIALLNEQGLITIAAQ